MAFSIKTVDEETIGMVDTYDAAIAPRKIWRNNNNKLYLIFRSIAAGFADLRATLLALKYRFDPRYCDADDLESTMFITGETLISGKASVARVIAYNTNTEESVALMAGEYVFTSIDGQTFSALITTDTYIPSASFEALIFASQDIGSWPVSASASLPVVRRDGLAISADITFEVFDNSGSLGRLPETIQEVRQRILTDTTRQDSIREMELAIRALPSIFECNLIFNASEQSSAPLEDGTILKPKELLIVVTGAPGLDLANIIVENTFYKTHMNTMNEVIWVNNPLLAAGKYPVYYMTHRKKRYYLTIHYQYDQTIAQKLLVDAQFDVLLRPYKTTTTHIDEINEPILYRHLEDHNIAGATIKKIYIQVMVDGSLESVASVDIPRLMIPELVSVTYIGDPING